MGVSVCSHTIAELLVVVGTSKKNIEKGLRMITTDV